MIKQKTILVFLCIVLWIDGTVFAQRLKFLKDPHFIITPSTTILLEKEFSVFENFNSNAQYRISIGADVPNNKKPSQLIYQMESGHVFIILEKFDTVKKDTIHKVFGFYPSRQGIILFFKKEVKARVKDNSRREYDIELSKLLSEEQFKTALHLSLQYSRRRYHLNKFNCYDYALDIFNAVAGTEPLPLIHTSFIFFGKGGSPCTFYKYLKQQKETNAVWAPNIRLGNLVAPVSTTIQEAHLGSLAK